MRRIILGIIATAALGAYSSQDSEYQFLLKETSEASKISEKEYQILKQIEQGEWNESFSIPGAQSQKRSSLNQRVEFNNEDFNVGLEKSLLLDLRYAIENNDPSHFKQHLAKDLKFSKASGVDKQKFTKYDGIAVTQMTRFSSGEGSKAFIKELSSYLGQFKKIEFVEAKLIGTVAPNADHYMVLLRARPELKSRVALDIRGISKTGQRRVDKADIVLTLVNKGNKLSVKSYIHHGFDSLRLEREPAFTRSALNAGFDNGKAYPRLEALRRGGYGFATGDFDNDGHLDAFVGNYGASTLWKSKNGSFTQIKSPQTEKITLAKAAAFVDLDNDGWKDLFITRFAADNAKGDIILFKNQKGTFVEVKGAFPSDILREYAMPTAIADFNNDGLLDIYVGFPGERDFSAGPRVSMERAVHGLFINKGGFKFSDTTPLIEAAFTSQVMPHGALASDFDSDGKVDLIVMDDQMNLSPTYRNMGNGKFELKNGDLHIMNYGYGMGVAAGDLNQDGHQDYLLSNATFNTQYRLAIFGSGRINPTEANKSNLFNKGLRLFLSAKNGTFSETTDIAGLGDPGEGAGGVTVIDYDNDGLLDIYLVNGLWSGSSRTDQLDTIFAKATSMNIVNQNHLQDGQGDRSPENARSMYMRALMKHKVNGKTLSFAGHQRNRLFKNLGNGKFIEVGYLENVDSMADGYMSVVADINQDGKADLILRNCDPGAPDHQFAAVEIFENQLKKGNSVWISLKGKKSNSMGVGAKLFATIKGKTHMREMIANNSAMQGEVIAHFGLDSSEKIDKLTIQWPSGLTNTYENIGKGRHVIEENVEAVASAK